MYTFLIVKIHFLGSWKAHACNIWGRNIKMCKECGKWAWEVNLTDYGILYHVWHCTRISILYFFYSLFRFVYECLFVFFVYKRINEGTCTIIIKWKEKEKKLYILLLFSSPHTFICSTVPVSWVQILLLYVCLFLYTQTHTHTHRWWLWEPFLVTVGLSRIYHHHVRHKRTNVEWASPSPLTGCVYVSTDLRGVCVLNLLSTLSFRHTLVLHTNFLVSSFVCYTVGTDRRLYDVYVYYAFK